MERIDEDSISIHNDTVALSSTESSSDNENENLAFYVNNRVKILQRMFKVLHTRKIMKMAPACLKNKNIAEIKAALIEELMGLSDRRVLQIINGDKEDHKGDGSSSESEVEHVLNPASRAIDGGVISLDDITDDDEIDVNPIKEVNIKIEKDESNSTHKKRHKKSSKKLVKKIKKEPDLDVVEVNEDKIPLSGDEKKDPAVMSALNLLELQARARAIRSQLRSELGELDSKSKNDKENEDGDKSNDTDKTNDLDKDITDDILNQDEITDLSDKIDSNQSLIDKKINEIIDETNDSSQDLSPNSVVCISPERDVIILDNSDMDFDEKDEDDSIQSKIPSRCVLIKTDEKNKSKTKNNEKHKHSRHKSKTNNGKHKHKSKIESFQKHDRTKNKNDDTIKSKVVCPIKSIEVKSKTSHDEIFGDKLYNTEEKTHNIENKLHKNLKSSSEQFQQKTVPDSKGKIKLKRTRFTKEDMVKMRINTEMKKEEKKVETTKMENKKPQSGDESDTSDVIICNVDKDIDLDI